MQLLVHSGLLYKLFHLQFSPSVMELISLSFLIENSDFLLSTKCLHPKKYMKGYD